MKYLITIAALLLSACGTDPAASTGSGMVACQGLSALGNWNDNVTGDVLTINGDCTGSNTYCQYAFTYTRPDGSGVTTLTLTHSNNAGGCMSAGTHHCSITTAGVNLTVNCGVDGTFNYTR
jgi:hypothetical protein